ncbi:hypothetical protein E2C01_096345 [Portunus trituberculatus]|uniref:Uncharacterized protein n=1 Tax=Portunus trituberculatus TaxID=210409 RepID=A0A5B7K2J3_PORTR|nr:hypothetical protein [Portunus trituberculatus]
MFILMLIIAVILCSRGYDFALMLRYCGCTLVKQYFLSWLPRIVLTVVVFVPARPS